MGKLLRTKTYPLQIKMSSKLKMKDYIQRLKRVDTLTVIDSS